MKTDVRSGVAVSVTVVPKSNCAEQAVPQLMPGGSLVTVPVPLPSLPTVSVLLPLKSATTVREASMRSRHWLPTVPAQSPPQPRNTLPAPAVAVSSTSVPLA
jgi:hypothetical protein